MAREKKKRFLMEEAAEKLELPGEVIAGMPKMSITGCRKLYVENHRGILEYGRERIRINGGRVILTVRGEQLDLRGMSGKELIITGELCGIDFEK